VRGAEGHAGEFAEQVRLLVGQCPGAEQPNRVEAVFPLDADVEMRLAQLSMGVKPDDRLIVLMGSEGADDDEGDSFTLAFDFRRGYELRRAIRDVVAAGRPPCPLCTAPMDPTGHICPRTNGHHPR
jgi:hypothetical protein